MATFPCIITTPTRGIVKGFWETMAANGDVGLPFDGPRYSDKSVQVTGAFGTGGTIILEGSNDGVNYDPLQDPLGTAISLTAAGSFHVLENTLKVRPRITAGTGSIDLDVTLIAKAVT